MVAVESDNLPILHMFNEELEDVRSFAMARRISELLGRQWEVHLEHTFREANPAAGFHSKIGYEGCSSLSYLRATTSMYLIHTVGRLLRSELL